MLAGGKRKVEEQVEGSGGQERNEERAVRKAGDLKKE